jgi:hypothetical protein
MTPGKDPVPPDRRERRDPQVIPTNDRAGADSAIIVVPVRLDIDPARDNDEVITSTLRQVEEALPAHAHLELEVGDLVRASAVVECMRGTLYVWETALALAARGPQG